MASDGATTPVETPGKASPSIAVNSPASALRAQHQSLGDAPAKRGRGRPPGSKSTAKPETTPVIPPVLDKDHVYEVCGDMREGLSTSVAYGTNCTAFLLRPEQKKKLGKVWGDIFIKFGWTDSSAFQFAAVIACETAVLVPQVIGYFAFVQSEQQKAQSELKKPTSENPPEKSGSPGSKDSPKGDDPWTSQPGLI